MIKAPFTDEQVTNLNRYQEEGLAHPFTCPGDKDSCQLRRRLVASPDGWVCQCGEYKQDWAHDFMTQDLREPFAGLRALMMTGRSPEKPE